MSYNLQKLLSEVWWHNNELNQTAIYEHNIATT